MHSPLEQYLEEVQSHLQALPQTQREEEVEEIRQHVETIVEAHEELGVTKEEAVTRALAQFGTARTVAQGLTRAFQRGDKHLQGDLKTATAVAFIGLVTLHTLQSRLFHALIPVHITGTQINALWPWFIGSLFMIPLVQGWLTAMVAPRKALGGVVLSMIILFTIHYTVNNPLRFIPIQMRVQQFAIDLLECVFSAALAMIGARAGIQWKKARLRRPRLA